MATPTTNFGLVTVSTGYDASAVTIALETGDGSRLPATTGGYRYPLTWWNATDYTHPADDPNREIVLVTARSSDTLTVTRAQEGTSASTKNTADKEYRMSLGITKTMWETAYVKGSTFAGLSLQTSLDADRAKYRVELTGVDYIVMDDGTVLDNSSDDWTDVAAEITTSGAGGLDTGTEESSTWYEVYAIAKEDGTRNLLLHKAPWQTADAFNVSGEDATQGIRSAVDNSTVKVAQGFQQSESGPVTVIEVKLIKVGTPTGNIWFTIEGDSGGVPDGNALVTSAKMDVSRIPTTALNMAIPCYEGTSLSASTQYWLVAQGDWTVSAANYIGWRMDGSAGSYASGSKALYDSDTAGWTTDTDDDMYFVVYGERDRSSVTMPSGYTRKCHIGYVRNNSSSDFAPFFQNNRTWQHRDISVTNHVDVASIALSGPNKFLLGGSTTAAPIRRQMRLHVGVAGTGAAAVTMALGDYTATDLNSSTGVGAQAVLRAELTAAVAHVFGSINILQGIIYAEGTSSGTLKIAAFEW